MKIDHPFRKVLHRRPHVAIHKGRKGGPLGGAVREVLECGHRLRLMASIAPALRRRCALCARGSA
jgi:hypothetical protein